MKSVKLLVIKRTLCETKMLLLWPNIESVRNLTKTKCIYRDDLEERRGILGVFVRDGPIEIHSDRWVGRIETARGT